MSTEDPNVPKRRSSAAKRRRRRSGQSAAPAPTTQRTESPAQGATGEESPAEPVDRHLQRREERRAAKAQSEKKGVARMVDPERFSGARGFYNDTTSEIRKVIWPDRNQTMNLTLLVIVLSVIMGSLLGGIDWVLLQVFENVV